MKIVHINPESREFTRGTLVFYIPSKDILNLLYTQQQNSLYIKIGASFVHPKDNYCKRTGVTRADTLALNEPSKYSLLTKIEPRDDRWVYHFTTLVPDTRPNTPNYIKVEFGISLSTKSPASRLEYACFTE